MSIWDYQWDFGPVFSAFPALLRGLLVTFQITGLAILIGTPLGVAIGIALTSSVREVRLILFFMTDALRAMPMLILMLGTYYFVPALVGIPGLDATTLAVIALSLNLSAFIAFVVRESILSFPTGLREAASACGLSKRATVVHVLLPHIGRPLIPVFSMMYIETLKLSSLASVIAVYELTHTADKIRTQTFQSLEVFAVVAGIYLIVVMPLSSLVRMLEKSRHFARRA